MIIEKTYKYKVIEDDEQWLNFFAQHAGCRRFVYNHFSDINIKLFNSNQKTLTNYEMDAQLVPLKNKYPFLGDVNSQMLQNVTKDVKRGINKFYSDLKNKIPRKRLLAFKKKYDDQSFSFPNYKNNVRFTHNYKVFNKPKVCYLKVPKLKTPIKILKHRNFEGEIKNVTFSKKGDCYYVSLQVKQSIELYENNLQSIIGIDLGVKRLINTSENEIFAPLNSYKKLQAKLKKAQRKLAKCVKFSNNFKRLKLKINKIHHKIAKMRLDYLHKISTYLIKNHAGIIVENLNVKNMVKKAKPKLGEDGKTYIKNNKKQKSGLSRNILEQGWGLFRILLTYKSKWYNTYFDDVPAKNTSMKCCQCGHIHKDNRQQQAVFECQICGFSINADFNASLNILYLGLLKMGLLKEEAAAQVNLKISHQEFITNL